MNDYAVTGHRIVTLTMNPALDITTSTEVVHSTDKLRCTAARYDPGGGGINVAHMAEVLGASATAIYPAGGSAGDTINELLNAEGVSVRPIHSGGSTRESLTVNERSTGRQFRFVLPGPELTLAEQTECLLQLRRAAASAAIVVASGSLPPGVPPDFYQQVANVCQEIGALFILDTSGGGLKHVTSGVFLLKPSLRELRECVGQELATESEQVCAARDLIGRGCAHHLVVSLGAEGALLVSPDSAYRLAAVVVPAGSGVGAGDAMVAGIAVGLTRGWPLTKSVRLGIAAGAAKLLTPGTAPCTREDTQRLFEQTEDPVKLELVTG
ncbi:1-phosphofructokinase family hexose kinase [Mycolicibacterium helvum]|uniref:6-phosphofructokinase n=1 Tax=Mycolicibacterium helvum TaxID=1534349 RepID=A0A7I7T2C5_9MYCO|nr:1-phosphofructokinase family hexose kinase [Mycolicibacterium helvum]BBY62216.1 6-phosphofructokinase [Mycolicibacterium helvum]